MSEESDAAATFSRNSAYAKKQSSYLTKLSPDDEKTFQAWVKNQNVPFDPSPTADYDMRGFFKAAQMGDPRAKTGINPNDGQIHFDDYWKTPYHKSFSNESQFATADAPAWNSKDQLVLPSGQVVYDERAAGAPQAPTTTPPAPSVPIAQLLQMLGQQGGSQTSQS